MGIEELKARLTEIGERLKELDVEFAGKRFSAEAKDEWNSLQAERDETRKTIAEIEVRMAQLEDAAEDETQIERGAGFNTRKSGTPTGSDIYDLAAYRAQSNSPEREAELLRDGAMRAIESSHYPHERARREDVQGHIEALVERHNESDGGWLARRILATGSPTYKRAFGKQLIGQPLTEAESRALSLTTTAGGFAVPFVLDPSIVPTSNGAVNPLRAISRVETVSVGEWKGVTSGGITAAYAAEGTEAGDNAPTLAQPDLITERAQAFVPYSIEVGGDWGSLQTEMAKLLQDAKDALEADKFVNGAGHGSNEPKGLLTAATGTVAAGTASFAVAHLYALQEGLQPRFEPNASFLAHNGTYNKVRQFDTAGGASLWVQLGQGTPSRLMDYPAYKSSAYVNALTTGSKFMTFGDFSYFLIVDRLGMNVELIPHLFGASGRPKGQRGLYAIWRNTSDVLSNAAFKTLQTT